jgi:hypothetical protein
VSTRPTSLDPTLSLLTPALSEALSHNPCSVRRISPALLIGLNKISKRMYHRGKTIQPDHTHAYDLEQQFARRFSSNDYVQPHGLCKRCNETCQRSPALRELLTLGFVRSNRDLPRNRSRRGCFAQAQGDDENDHLELLRRYSSLKELEESYLNSCHFCALILHTMDPRNIAGLHKHARIAKSSSPIVINIAKVSPPLLIITSDVEPFQNRQHVSLLASEGQYSFRVSVIML